MTTIRYTNWKGETAERQIVPVELWHGATEYHPEAQWLLRARDITKDALRDFAVRDIHAWSFAVPVRARGDDAVQVSEHNFPGANCNLAQIQLRGRYPVAGFACNDICTAIVSVRAGNGAILRPDHKPQQLAPGDHVVIAPGEAYAWRPAGKLLIDYLSTPTWTAGQARTIE